MLWHFSGRLKAVFRGCDSCLRGRVGRFDALLKASTHDSPSKAPVTLKKVDSSDDYTSVLILETRPDL